MIELVDSSKVEPIDDIREAYPNFKVLLTNVDFSDMSHIGGSVYKISKSSDSFRDLCVEREELEREGASVMIIGSYNNGVGIGVQYEFGE